MSSLPVSVLTALLGIRVTDAPLSGTLDQIVKLAKEAIEASEEVSTTLVRSGKAFTAAFSGQLGMDADELQYEQGYGPCIDAGESGSIIVVDDMRTETRWRDYAARVVPLGVLSSMSIPLPIQTEVVGALNCYSRSANAFGREDIAVGTEVASYIAAAAGNALAYNDTSARADGMRVAMESRASIEQAKGIIMSQSHCGPDAAFDILRRASQNRNMKLRQLAEEIVAKADRKADSSN